MPVVDVVWMEKGKQGCDIVRIVSQSERAAGQMRQQRAWYCTFRHAGNDRRGGHDGECSVRDRSAIFHGLSSIDSRPGILFLDMYACGMRLVLGVWCARIFALMFSGTSVVRKENRQRRSF